MRLRCGDGVATPATRTLRRNPTRRSKADLQSSQVGSSLPLATMLNSSVGLTLLVTTCSVCVTSDSGDTLSFLDWPRIDMYPPPSHVEDPLVVQLGVNLLQSSMHGPSTVSGHPGLMETHLAAC